MRFLSFVPWNNLKILATQLDDRSIKSCFVGTCPCLVNSVAIIYIYNFSALLCNCFFWLDFVAHAFTKSLRAKGDWFPSQEKRLASKQKKQFCDHVIAIHLELTIFCTCIKMLQISFFYDCKRWQIPNDYYLASQKKKISLIVNA
jgi:hypothetical protein